MTPKSLIPIILSCTSSEAHNILPAMCSLFVYGQMASMCEKLALRPEPGGVSVHPDSEVYKVVTIFSIVTVD